MANYNTRGTKHESYRKEFDTMFNKGYVWSDLFDRIVRDSLVKTTDIYLSSHTKQQIENNVFGNRIIKDKEINLKNLMDGEVVEIEFRYEDYNGEDFNCLKKAVIRLPRRIDGEQVVAVCEFNYSGSVFVRTAWLNKANDNHDIGLDISDFDWNLNQKFGYFHKRWTSRVWELNNGKIGELIPNVAMTIEEYNKRNNY